MARDGSASVVRGVLVLAVIGSGFGLGSGACAQDAGAGDAGGAFGGPPDYPIPSSAREALSPIGEGFESPLQPTDDLKGPKPYVDERAAELKARRRGLAPFFRDTELEANSRSYWFEEDVFGLSEPEALTTGGSLSYQSGYAGDFLQLRGVVYTSQPLYAPPGAGETLNLAPDGDQITTLGQANARLKFLGQELSLGRQLVRTAYVNPFDSRMIPLTFEGIVLLPEEQNNDQPLDYIVSYLWRYKERHEAEFIPMSEGLGVAEDEGMLITGIRHRARGLNYGLANYWIEDTMNTAYGEVDYGLTLGGGPGAPSLRFSLNDIDQRSVGEALIPGPTFATYQASARAIASYGNFVLAGAVSRVGRDAPFRKPFGYSPAFTTMMVSSFQRAGEQALLASLSYDLSGLGLNGLKLYAAWGRGIDAIDTETDDAPLPDREELDLRLEYQPHGGPLEGLKVQLGYVDQRLIGSPTPSEDLTQFRAVVNYLVPLL